MVRRPKPVTKQLANLNRSQLHLGISRLDKLIAKVKQFNPQTVTDQYDIPEVKQLSAAIGDALLRTFGPDTVDYDLYRRAADFDNGPHNYAYHVPIEKVQHSLTRSKSANVALLEQAFASLNERLAEEEALSEPEDLEYALANELEPQAMERSDKKIFIVHGHADGPREAIARFLAQLNLEPIILHEQANRGKTIIEKFEAHADVGFAIVLLTPDDIGGPIGGPQHHRARQNVILELGFFIGRLGRARVCALMVPDVEIPSDILGVVWTSFDSAGAWKQGLAKELQAAGYRVNWNLVMV
jgi:predicted nucleotide-binding protein